MPFIGKTSQEKMMLKKIGSLALLASPALSFAAVPADVTTAISTMQADGVTVATVFLVAFIAVAAIKFLRSAK